MKILHPMWIIGVFPKWSRTFIEFSESDKSQKHELGSILRSCLLHVSCWHYGSIPVSYTRDGSSLSWTIFWQFCVDFQVPQKQIKTCLPIFYYSGLQIPAFTVTLHKYDTDIYKYENNTSRKLSYLRFKITQVNISKSS